MWLRTTILSSLALVACSGPDEPLFVQSVTLTSPSTNGAYYALAVSGNHIYAGADQIYVYELSGDTDVTEVGTPLGFGNNIRSLAARGNALYYDWGTGTQIADISVPGVITPIKPLADFDLLAFAQVNASSTQRFVGSSAVDDYTHIIVWDLLDPLDPVHAGDIHGADSSAITVDGNLLYAGAQVWDITNLAAPQLVGTASGVTASPDVLFAIGDGLVYCGHGKQGIPGPTLLDARDPTQPMFSNQDWWGDVELFARTGNVLFTMTGKRPEMYVGGIPAVFDISDPLEPRYMESNETGGAVEYGAGIGVNSYTIIANAGHVYSAHVAGLTITAIRPR